MTSTRNIPVIKTQSNLDKNLINLISDIDKNSNQGSFLPKTSSKPRRLPLAKNHYEVNVPSFVRVYLEKKYGNPKQAAIFDQRSKSTERQSAGSVKTESVKRGSLQTGSLQTGSVKTGLLNLVINNHILETGLQTSTILASKIQLIL